MPFQNQIKGKLEYLISDCIGAGHCFSTRLGGVSEGYLSELNLGMHRGDSDENVRENFRILGQAVGFEPEDLVMNHQIHSDIVRVVSRADCRGLDHHQCPQADGLITNEPGLALVAFTADCTPILLWDPVTGAVGAVHAGWRGTVADIAGKAIKAMADAYDCKPENIRAAIGPNIGKCCFETDSDVPRAVLDIMGKAGEPFIRQTGEKYRVDLKGVNAALLRRAGVEQVDISRECTACRPDRFWSHRMTRGQRGSQAAIIVCKGER